MTDELRATSFSTVKTHPTHPGANSEWILRRNEKMKRDLAPLPSSHQKCPQNYPDDKCQNYENMEKCSDKIIQFDETQMRLKKQALL